jgi:hypothetical protein
MSNPTSNYSFQMPTNTDLVYQLPADFEVFGQAVDTQMKTNADAATQKATLTTKGDLYAASAASTPARLGVGSNGQVLTADSAAATGVKWATVAASGSTLVARTSFSNVASQAFDNVFSSSYFNYLVIIERFSAATSSSTMQMQMRYGGTTNTGANYNGNLLHATRANTTITNLAQSSTTEFTLSNQCGDASQSNSMSMTFVGVGNASENASWSGTGTSGNGAYGASFYGGSTHLSQTYDGFLLKASASNITGVVSIYGLAK